LCIAISIALTFKIGSAVGEIASGKAPRLRLAIPRVQVVRVKVYFPRRVVTVFRGFFPAPVVVVTVVLPIFIRLVVRVPVLV
jgi:hypothetical protein